jgi:hypothetical protein
MISLKAPVVPSQNLKLKQDKHGTKKNKTLKRIYNGTGS